MAVSFTKTVLLFSAIGSDGLCCQSREIKEWHGCRATRGVTKGRYQMMCFEYSSRKVWASLLPIVNVDGCIKNFLSIWANLVI